VKKAVLVVLCLCLSASWARAVYVIILRNGNRIVAQEKYQVKGANAVFRNKVGTLMSVPLEQIDVAKTERINGMNLGDAVALEWVDEVRPTPVPTPTPSVATLGKIRSGLATPEADAARPTPTPGITFHDRPYPDRQVELAFTEGLERSHLYLYRMSEGTRPRYFFMEVQVGGQAEVLKALDAIATVYHLLAQTAADRAPERVEIQMLNESGKEAGLFRLSTDDAAELALKKITAQEFFVKHVIF
jgi:hypothetical protein